MHVARRDHSSSSNSSSSSNIISKSIENRALQVAITKNRHPSNKYHGILLVFVNNFSSFFRSLALALVCAVLLTFLCHIYFIYCSPWETSWDENEDERRPKYTRTHTLSLPLLLCVTSHAQTHNTTISIMLFEFTQKMYMTVLSLPLSCSTVSFCTKNARFSYRHHSPFRRFFSSLQILVSHTTDMFYACWAASITSYMLCVCVYPRENNSSGI